VIILSIAFATAATATAKFAAWWQESARIVSQRTRRFLTTCLWASRPIHRRHFARQRRHCHVDQDVMRVFPAWPKTVDARFANLREFGAFLVTSELKSGEILLLTPAD
jgi:hypothetical protein